MRRGGKRMSDNRNESKCDVCGESTQAAKIRMAGFFTDEQTTVMIVGTSATPEFLGQPVTLDEGVDSKYTPLGRPVRWRIEQRGARHVRCSNFSMTKDEVIRSGKKDLIRAIGIAESAEVTLEILLPPPFTTVEELERLPAQPLDTVTLDERDRAAASQLATLSVAERWFASSATDPTLKSLFWNPSGLLICAACGRTTADVGRLLEMGLEADCERPTIYFGVCSSCATKLDQPTVLEGLARKVVLMVEQAMAGN
jgi:hypothetical protein